MKRSLMFGLATALLIGLNAQAKPQQDAQAKPANPHHYGATQGDQSKQITVDRLSAIMDLSQANQNLYHAKDQNVQSSFSWNNVLWDISNQTADLSLTPADDALRAHLGLPKDQGLIVTALAPNCSAAQAGIQQNDVLLKLNDSPLAKPDDLDTGLKGAGDKPASLTVLRAGKKIAVQVQPRVRVTMGPVQPEPPAFWIGVSVSDLEPALRSQLKLPQNQGLLAIQVFKDSPAAKADVKVHDILLTLADKPLDSQQKLIEIVQASGEKSIPLELIRQGKTQTIEVTPQRRKSPQLSLRFQPSSAEAVLYQVVRPGAVVGSAYPNIDYTTTFTPQVQGADSKQPQEAAAVSKRLDDVDAEIKQLRMAIEELSRAIKDKN